MNELLNRLVWVHPIAYDPLSQLGNFGRIASIQPEKNLAIILLQNGQSEKFTCDTIFLLKPSVLLLEHIYGKNLNNWNDRRAILDIYYLAQTGKIENIEKATEMATQNPVVADSSLVSIREWMDLCLVRITDRYKS